MVEAARLAHPNLKRSTVNSIIRTFRQEKRIDRRPTTIGHLLKRHQVSMKHIYLVPFERNNDWVKQLQAEYAKRVMVLDAAVNHHKYIFFDEAGFNLAKTWRCRRNLIGQRATAQVPGKHGGNISICTAISEDGVVERRPLLGSYNAAHLIVFLNEIEQACQGEGVTYVIVWDNVRFHHAEVVQAWFRAYPRFVTLYLPPYSPFLNPIEDFSSAWRWKVYDHHPHELAMDETCDDIKLGFAMPKGFSHGA
ncbi:uncharacterized protein LOC121586508 [Coregonus clupeaformis]|uniref:uncharacterized protein LOC121586508 n=1 Tax=Coregonus clupeaformis TaxID=59861 RepID=UPI001BE03AFF|nr:uncharacterized protein LOC121586508 [Coregonus clupeaformis]